jgi:hypothetical protein
MSTASSRSKAYAAFLAGSDCDTWTSCLREYEEILDGAIDPHDGGLVDLRHALTIVHYLAWLLRREGDDPASNQAARRFRALAARIARTPLPAGREVTLIHAVIAAAKGYAATARKMVQSLAEPPPVEVALLTAPERAAARAAWLKPFLHRAAGPAFVPALYFYGASLLDLGYLSEADAVERQSGATGSPPMIDLRGQLLELAGAWKEARDAYGPSPRWALHFYRKTVCNLILGESVDHLAGLPEDLVGKFKAGMLDFGGETDRAAVARSASFVRACRWSGFDNWLVHFELGRLCFQRRRHAEAERHLAAAARGAPAPYRFPMLSLRFANLTWLGDELELSTTPETLEAAHAALQATASEEERAYIRTWMGRFGDEAGILEPVFGCSSDYHIGLAHSHRASVPEAVASWCSSIEATYTPRAFFELLKVFASWGFEKTASRFAEIVALESGDSFFDLWELAHALGVAVAGQVSSRLSTGPLKDQLASVEARLEKLVESDFQNAIRAFYHFLGQRRLEPASRKLLVAEKLAEGPEEKLRLAIARRRAAVGEWDLLSLRALHRAELQSEDRLERLLIARELALLGQLPQARAILTREGAFSSALDLTPVEYVLALQIAEYCVIAEPERQVLERAAVATLQRDVDAGRFLWSGRRFVERLETSLKRSSKIPIPAKEQPAEAEASSWQTLVSELARLHREQRADQELRLLNERVEALAAATSPFSHFALWGLHRDRMNVVIRAVDQLHPNVADDQIPMARDLALVRLRAQALAGRWDEFLLATRPSEAEQRLAEIRDFLDEERQLTERWDRLRRAEARQPVSYAQRYAEQAALLLDRIRTGVQRADPWPGFLGLRNAVVEDVGDLAELIGKRAGSVRDRMSA